MLTPEEFADQPIVCSDCGKTWTPPPPGCSWRCWRRRKEGTIFTVIMLAWLTAISLLGWL